MATNNILYLGDGKGEQGTRVVDYDFSRKGVLLLALLDTYDQEIEIYSKYNTSWDCQEYISTFDLGFSKIFDDYKIAIDDKDTLFLSYPSVTDYSVNSKRNSTSKSNKKLPWEITKFVRRKGSI